MTGTVPLARIQQVAQRRHAVLGCLDEQPTVVTQSSGGVRDEQPVQPETVGILADVPERSDVARPVELLRAQERDVRHHGRAAAIRSSGRSSGLTITEALAPLARTCSRSVTRRSRRRSRQPAGVVLNTHLEA